MFGISFWELLLIGTVALLVVGPAKLPKMLGTLGIWIGKARRLTTEVRQQSGIDEVLKKEGLAGGLSELRGIVRSDLSGLGRLASAATSPRPAPKPRPGLPSRDDPYDGVASDTLREYPPEGCDAAGALPDDLWADAKEPPPVVEPSDEQPTIQVSSSSDVQRPVAPAPSVGPLPPAPLPPPPVPPPVASTSIAVPPRPAAAPPIPSRTATGPVPRAPAPSRGPNEATGNEAKPADVGIAPTDESSAS